MKLSLLFILIFLFAGCEPKGQLNVTSSEAEDTSINAFTEDTLITPFTKDTLLNLYKASLVAPKGWRFANDDTLSKAADMTYRKRLHNRSGKLVYIEHGFQVSRDPSEPNVVPARDRAGSLTNRIDTSGVLFSDDPGIPEYRKKQGLHYIFERIAGHRAKLFEPVRTGVGYTGVYIDSVGRKRNFVAEFVMYSENLDSLEMNELKKVIRTLSLKPFNE